jgi:DnaK suppressor protein
MTVSTKKDKKPAEATTEETLAKPKVRVAVKPRRVAAPAAEVVVAPVEVIAPPPAPVVAAAPAPTVVVKVKRKRVAVSSKDAANAAAAESALALTVAKTTYTSTMPAEVQSLAIPVPKDEKLANNWKNTDPSDLTDAELLAMPEAEYMNKAQLAAFRIRLQRLKRGILDNAGETSEHLREDNAVVPDPSDRATIEEEHAIELRTRDRERKLLKKIEQSITRIDSGDYGYCDETGEPIGVGRLLARPTATLSLEAQQRRELRQKMCGN